jgi:hypothetical protein
MSESAGFPPSPVRQPSRLPTWVIVVIAIVILCCFCGGMIGMLFAFWDPIQQTLGLSALLPLAILL